MFFANFSTGAANDARYRAGDQMLPAQSSDCLYMAIGARLGRIGCNRSRNYGDAPIITFLSDSHVSSRWIVPMEPQARRCSGRFWQLRVICDNWLRSFVTLRR